MVMKMRQYRLSSIGIGLMGRVLRLSSMESGGWLLDNRREFSQVKHTDTSEVYRSVT